MTSKSLFIRLQKEDFKRRIWTIALSLLAFFVILPIFCALNLDDYTNYDERKWIIESIIEFMGPAHLGVFVVTIACAVICGISGFYFLQSKKRVDFYHSIPVRREVFFAVNYLNGFLIFFLPYILNVLVCFAILRVNNYMNLEIFRAALSAVLINTLYYGLIYTIVIIAVMLTGNVIVSILGAGVFLSYGPLIMVVKEMYFRYFFETYYTESRLTECIKFLSPLGSYVDTIERWSNEESIAGVIIALIIITIVLIVFAIFLYQKRPSEAAGNAMAFSISKPIIKVMLVILLTLGGGVLFRSIVSSNYDGWFLFGLIFSLIIVAGVIEIIFNFDIRSAFGHKKQLLVCIVIIAEIACVFRLDVLHYDSYLPKENDIESMSVVVSDLDDNIDYVEFINDKASYSNSNDYQLKNMKLTDFKDAYELVKMGVERLGSKDETNYSDRKYNYCVKYSLKNGREIYRTYSMDTDTSYELLKGLFTNKEFKEAHYPINQWEAEDIGKVSLRYYSDIINDSVFGMDGQEGFELNLNSQEKKEFINTYKEELNATSLDELADSEPIATIRLEVNKYDVSNYYIYPSYKKTLAKIEDYGFDTSKIVDADDVLELYAVEYYSAIGDTSSNSDGTVTVDTSEPLQVTYSDKEIIANILPALVPRDYYYNNSALIDVEQYVEVNLSVFNKDYNDSMTYGYMFKKGEIPDFIREELQLN